MVTEKYLKRIFMRKPYFVHGFEYQFIDIQGEDDDSTFNITVNVVLPKKGMSFVTQVFSDDVFGIIEHSWNITGQQFSFTEKLLIDGKPTPESGIYINPEDRKKVLENLNQGIGVVKLDKSKNNFYEQVSANIIFSYPKSNFNDNFYIDSLSNIQVSLEYELRDIKLDGQKASLNLKHIDEFGNRFNENLQYSDRLVDVIHEIIWNTLEPSVNLENNPNDIFYNISFWLTKIDGLDVDVEGTSKTRFSPEMFN